MLDVHKKLKGAFFTSGEISSYLLNRVIENSDQKILEPSFGDGAFVDPIIEMYKNRWPARNLKNTFFGVEIREEAISKYKSNPALDPAKIILGDFLSVTPFPVDLVIGNPPYVGLNKIPLMEQQRANSLLALHNFKMQRSGSLWFPFLLHACAFLKEGGTIAFVLPFELTYVRYARQLWKFLGDHFSELSIVRVFEDIFPDVDVETVLFIGKGYGGSTNFVNYELYADKVRLLNGMLDKERLIPIESILSGSRPFVWGLLEDAQLQIIDSLRSRGIITPINQFCKFKIGYVSADQEFFHPSAEKIAQFGLGEQVLVPALANAKALKKGVGLFVKRGHIRTRLFLPLTDALDEGTNDYIQYGMETGIDSHYKCRLRKPWYRTPGVEIPDVFLTVFSDRAGLYVNQDRIAASNSLLCGFFQNGLKPETLASCWYNSLTQLSIELKIHSLGGGVLVFIPGEANSLEVINPDLVEKNISFLSELDGLIKQNKINEAYLLGDRVVLKKIGISPVELQTLQDAIKTLRMWRDPKCRKTGHVSASSAPALF